MTSLTDTDFVPMRLGKVVAVGDRGRSFVLRRAGGRDRRHAAAHLDRRDGRVLPVCRP